jgi:hypothetical protein
LRGGSSVTFIRPGKGEESVVVQPSAILPRGAGRLDALNALEAAIVGDTLATIDTQVGDGWRAEDAIDSYRSWVVRTIDAAIDEGVCRWIAEEVAA